MVREKIVIVLSVGITRRTFHVILVKAAGKGIALSVVFWIVSGI